MMAAESPPPEREELRNAIHALPYVGQKPVLDTRAAMAALFDIQRNNPKLAASVRSQIDAVESTFKGELEILPDEHGVPHYVLPTHVLRSVIARSIFAGGMQAAYGIGATLEEVQALEAGLDGPTAGGEMHDGGEAAPPAT